MHLATAHITMVHYDQSLLDVCYIHAQCIMEMIPRTHRATPQSMNCIYKYIEVDYFWAYHVQDY